MKFVLIGIVRGFWRVPVLVLLVLLGLVTTGLFFHLMRRSQREAVTMYWSRCLLWALGVKVQREGQLLQDGPVMLVANHVSWIDIFVLNSCRTTYFIAKDDILKWPVVGKLVAWSGTIFVDRSSRQAMRQVNTTLAQRYQEQACTGLFPEGTTTDGLSVKGFFAGLFEAPLRAGVPIQPVALLLYYRGERSGLAAYIGEQSLVQNIWVLLSHPGIAMTVRYLAPIQTSVEAEVASLAPSEVVSAVAAPALSSASDSSPSEVTAAPVLSRGEVARQCHQRILAEVERRP